MGYDIAQKIHIQIINHIDLKRNCIKPPRQLGFQSRKGLFSLFLGVNNMENTLNTKPEDINELHKKWYWFLIIGIICLAGGIFSLYQPFFATLTVEILTAWVFIFSGIANIIQAFQTAQKGKGWVIASGVLLILLGNVLILMPLEGIISLTLAVAALLIFYGVMQISYAFQLRPSRGWGWLFLSGFISVLLGIIIFAEIDTLAGIALGTFLAINLIMNGTALIFTSFAIKNKKQ